MLIFNIFEIRYLNSNFTEVFVLFYGDALFKFCLLTIYVYIFSCILTGSSSKYDLREKRNRKE